MSDKAYYSSQQPDPREALDALNEQNRLLIEARMLPENETLQPKHHFAVIEAFGRYIGKRGITPAQVAREVNYTESVISEWKRNTYKGDIDKVTRAVNVWMERDARRQDAAKPRDYVPMWVVETIRAIIFQADKQGCMAAIVAPAGSGKTKVLRALSDQMRGVYMYVSAKISETDFLASLAFAVTNKIGVISKGRQIQRIVDKLAESKRIIFLDEAQNLGKSVGAVRSIHDQAQVPIVMAGTADILDMVDDRAHGRGQFSSRTIRCNLLDFISNVEDPEGTKNGRPLFTEQEMKAFLASRGMRLTDDAAQMCWALACLPNYGCLRLVGMVTDVAKDANRNAAVLTREHLLAALQMVVGVDAQHLKTVAERVVKTIANSRRAAAG